MAALALAERARRITAGRFDPRVVVDLERLGFAAAPQAWARRPPGDEPLLRRAPDGCIALSAPVDLGGLGKGIALRRACRAAAARLPGAGLLIDAGGDIVTLGRPDPANAASRWSIAIEDPSGAGEPMATFAVPDRWAVATSSTRIARRLDDAGLMVHHLIDPRTGTPGGGGLVAVTVAFPDPAWAEVWTKELFLEGPSGIGARARGRGLAAWWVGPDGSLSMTPAARQVTTWVRSEVELSPPAASVARRPPSPNPATG
jgi:thiamine biosynthesis lipoprotein